MVTSSYPIQIDKVNPAPGPIDLTSELKEAIAARDFATASRLRKALQLTRPDWMILPLVSPASPAWGEGGGE